MTSFRNDNQGKESFVLTNFPQLLDDIQNEHGFIRGNEAKFRTKGY